MGQEGGGVLYIICIVCHRCNRADSASGWTAGTPMPHRDYPRRPSTGRVSPRASVADHATHRQLVAKGICTKLQSRQQRAAVRPALLACAALLSTYDLPANLVHDTLAACNAAAVPYLAGGPCASHSALPPRCPLNSSDPLPWVHVATPCCAVLCLCTSARSRRARVQGSQVHDQPGRALVQPPQWLGQVDGWARSPCHLID